MADLPRPLSIDDVRELLGVGRNLASEIVHQLGVRVGKRRLFVDAGRLHDFLTSGSSVAGDDVGPSSASDEHRAAGNSAGDGDGPQGNGRSHGAAAGPSRRGEKP